MDLTEYIRILRQRWLVAVLPLVAALLAAFLTLPETQTAGPAVTTYRATATLIASPLGSTGAVPLSLQTVSLFATLGEIPERAAKRLDYPGEPQVLASLITVSSDPETGTLAISSSDAGKEAVVDRVNTFADVTIEFFREQELKQARARIVELDRQVKSSNAQIRTLQAELGETEDPVILSQIQAVQTNLTTQYSELNQLRESIGKSDLLNMLQPAVAIPEATSGFVAPTNPWVRLGLAGFLGIMLGAALALLVERLDSRMRSREQVEDVTGLPVLAEIPRLPRLASHRRDEIVSATRPAGAAAEAYRSLRSSLLLAGPNGLADQTSDGGGALTILVTSGLRGEGKTTTVANLAAVMAEAGRRVLVISLDLRDPRLHRYFGVVNVAGASDLLAADRGRHLGQVVRPTDLPGVSVVTSGEPTNHPGALLASVGPMITAARSLADVVLIDSPPMLVVADALDIARHTDVTLLVTRLNRTTRSQAGACQRAFSRLDISAFGSVLVGSRATGTRYGYPLMGDHEGSTSAREGSDTPSAGGATSR